MAFLLKFMGLAAAFLLIQTAMAANLIVGGPNGGWNLNTDLKAWAASQTFSPGDTLIFSFAPIHSVIEVPEADYSACTVTGMLQAYTGGSAVVKLSAPGKRYFICGAPGHCALGMKVEITTVSASIVINPPPPASPAIPTPTISSPPPPASPAVVPTPAFSSPPPPASRSVIPTPTFSSPPPAAAFPAVIPTPTFSSPPPPASPAVIPTPTIPSPPPKPASPVIPKPAVSSPPKPASPVIPTPAISSPPPKAYHAIKTPINSSPPVSPVIRTPITSSPSPSIQPPTASPVPSEAPNATIAGDPPTGSVAVPPVTETPNLADSPAVTEGPTTQVAQERNGGGRQVEAGIVLVVSLLMALVF